VIQAADGNFYGTTRERGTSSAGTVFQLTPSGTLTTLHAFTGGADGAYPEAAFIQAVDGTFSGTPYQGGIDDNGTVFQFTLPLTNAAITANLASPQPVGTALTLTATVTGGTAPQQCKWLLTTDPAWATYTVLRTWQSCTTPVPWTPTSPGSYVVAVWARSSGSTVDAREAGAGLAYEIQLNLAGNWNYSENGIIRYTYTYAGGTVTDTEPVGGSGVVTVVQNLTDVIWTTPVRAMFEAARLRGTTFRSRGSDALPRRVSP
jgi:uncharacterized repeat protein (TIGR03803 family)